MIVCLSWHYFCVQCKSSTSWSLTVRIHGVVFLLALSETGAFRNGRLRRRGTEHSRLNFCQIKVALLVPLKFRGGGVHGPHGGSITDVTKMKNRNTTWALSIQKVGFLVCRCIVTEDNYLEQEFQTFVRQRSTFRATKNCDRLVTAPMHTCAYAHTHAHMAWWATAIMPLNMNQTEK